LGRRGDERCQGESDPARPPEFETPEGPARAGSSLAPLAGGERRRALDTVVAEIKADLPSGLKHIAKARCRQHRSCGTAAIDPEGNFPALL